MKISIILQNGIANKNDIHIELSEQQTDTPPRQCQSLDNVTMDINASIYWKITDPKKAVYDVDVLPKAISDMALNTLRSDLGKMKLDQILSKRKQLNEKVARQLESVGRTWGVQFTKVEIQEISYSSEIAEAMAQEMTAERKKRALISESEGEAASKIKIAEAEAHAMKTKAQAQADVIRLIANAESEYISKLNEVTTKEISGQIIISQKYIDGMKAISENPSDKVFLPNNFQGMFELSTKK